MSARRKEKRWRRVATHKRDVIVLQIVDALRQLSWTERVMAVRAAALLVEDPNLHDRLMNR